MKKKTLQVVNVPFVLPYYFGDQIEFLKQNGIDITIACSPGPELTKFCLKYDVGSEPVNVLRKIDLTTDLKSLFKLFFFIKKERFDYVIGHTPKGGLLSMVAAKLAGVKNRIYFRHGIVFETSSGFKRRLMLTLEKLTSACATKIVSVSNSVQEYSLRANINLPHKSVILNKGTCNGVDMERFVKSDSRKMKSKLGLGDSFVVGYVGRLVSDKGITELVEAMNILKRSIPGVKLLLVGPFEERDSLAESVREQVLNDSSIFFTDLVEDTVPFYNAMDVFILPSYREGFPTVVLEASAMELPVITTRSTGCVDSIVESKTGVYTNIDSISIAENVAFYFNNPAKRNEHGKNGREWVSNNFDQKIVWECIKNEIFN